VVVFCLFGGFGFLGVALLGAVLLLVLWPFLDLLVVY
jgi:hypothetical protein